jgi:cobalt transporter subunit CbtA
MFRNLFFAAILAALCAGLVNSAIQYFRVTPLILHAETFEGGAHSHDAATPAHTHEPEEWAPQDGFERTAYTVLANLLAAAGFALVIGAVSLFANLPITFANGVVWGFAGFLVFTLAPAFGLAPELPGMPAAEVFPRQLWWWGTVIATGAAALLLAKTRATWAIALAVVLVAAPHFIGAPQPPEEASAVPAHLATEFAAAALGTAAVFWIVLGLAFGRLNDFFAGRKTA